ncbi:DegV family protein [Paenibacillus camelliae]|uniref:DegV family protein n=1 Tax=Paenibacillus camelliae TaxID=512410 RepID=UPI00203A8B76|nr:DegV family protein [Paenibacillus camelliae]MCM3634376.1 DegV family protein [Paenibacillus camelliae]
MIVDSCCDATQALIKELNLIKIPLNLMLGDREIVDNEQLDLTQFMADMKACTGKVGSSAPAPALYQEAFDQAENSFAVTLSSRLSSSYSSAMLGKEMMESTSNDVYVFDSKSASAGQLLIVLKIYELAQLGLAKSDIISRTEDFIKHMKTYFVLDNIDNLMKNGRLSKVKGKLINMLNIKPLLGSDGDGNIVSYSNVKGQTKIVKKLVDTISDSGKNTVGENAVISHCNNEDLANRLKQAIAERFQFKDIVVVPTGGVSSLYANDKGIILAF